jgi:hypothetical protein
MLLQPVACCSSSAPAMQLVSGLNARDVHCDSTNDATMLRKQEVLGLSAWQFCSTEAFTLRRGWDINAVPPHSSSAFAIEAGLLDWFAGLLLAVRDAWDVHWLIQRLICWLVERLVRTLLSGLFLLLLGAAQLKLLVARMRGAAGASCSGAVE